MFFFLCLKRPGERYKSYQLKGAETYATMMTEAADAMLASWQAREKADGAIDIAEEMMSLTLRIIGQALFSIDLTHEVNTVEPAVTTLVKLLGDYVYAPFPSISVPM